MTYSTLTYVRGVGTAIKDRFDDFDRATQHALSISTVENVEMVSVVNSDNGRAYVTFIKGKEVEAL